jgi:hypothetical protein
MLRLLTVAIFLCFFLIACKKEENKTFNIPPLQKTTGLCCGDSTAETLYLYDNMGRLVGTRFSNNNGHYSETDFSYDNQGRLASAKDSSSGYGATTMFFNHDNNGRIIERVQYISNPASIPFRTSYGYDNSGRVIADTQYNYLAPGIFGYTTYTYDQDDNVITIKTYNNNSGVFQLQATQQAQYDSNPNPFYDIRVPLYYHGYPASYTLSRNNITVYTTPNHPPFVYTYQYNPDGSPNNWTQPGTYLTRMNFYY